MQSDSGVFGLVGTLLGGLIAGSVSLFTTYKVLAGTKDREQQKLHADRDAVRRDLLRGKLEALADHLFEHLKYRRRFASEIEEMATRSTEESWFNDGENSYDGWKHQDHFAHARVIQTLYFVELAPSLDAIEQATADHMNFCRTELRAIANNRTEWVATAAAEFITRRYDAIEPLMRSHDLCMESLRARLNELLE